MKRRDMMLVMLLIGPMAVVSAQATAPFFGKWKVNSGKSEDFGNYSITFSGLPDGAIRSQQGDSSYTFRVDGKEHSQEYPR